MTRDDLKVGQYLYHLDCYNGNYELKPCEILNIGLSVIEYSLEGRASSYPIHSIDDSGWLFTTKTQPIFDEIKDLEERIASYNSRLEKLRKMI